MNQGNTAKDLRIQRKKKFYRKNHNKKRGDQDGRPSQRSYRSSSPPPWWPSAQSSPPSQHLNPKKKSEKIRKNKKNYKIERNQQSIPRIWRSMTRHSWRRRRCHSRSCCCGVCFGFSKLFTFSIKDQNQLLNRENQRIGEQIEQEKSV